MKTKASSQPAPSNVDPDTNPALSQPGGSTAAVSEEGAGVSASSPNGNTAASGGGGSGGGGPQVEFSLPKDK